MSEGKDDCTKSTPGASIHLNTEGTKVPDDTGETICLNDNLRRARAELQLKIDAMKDKRKDLDNNIALAEAEIKNIPQP